METRKNDQRRPIPSCLGCFGITFFLCFGILGALVLLMPFIAKIRQTELAPEFVPMAEVLLDTSHEIQYEGFSLHLSFIQDYGQVWTSSYVDTDVVCVTAELFREDYTSFQNNSVLYINGVLIIGATDIFFGVDDSLSYSASRQLLWCAYGELQSGIHLIEFHLKDSFWGEPIHIQQWAIEID